MNLTRGRNAVKRQKQIGIALTAAGLALLAYGLYAFNIGIVLVK